MIELKQGCRVPYPEKLFEQYEVSERVIYANVNASKVMDIMRRFITERQEYVFFILELPSNQSDETETAPGMVDTFHMDVYFMDGLDREHALQMLDAVGPLLIADGMNTFGFGGHESHEEILFERYNVMRVYCADTAKYTSFFADFHITEAEQLVTAWDTFDPEHPGECERVEQNGKTIFDIPTDFEQYGLYFYERRGDEDTRPITFEELIGKVMLVGLTYLDKDGECTEQKQVWGTVDRFEDVGINLTLSTGEDFWIPPDLNPIKRAKPGKYTLHSTGEIVFDPDFTATWSITYPAEQE